MGLFDRAKSKVRKARMKYTDWRPEGYKDSGKASTQRRGARRIQSSKNVEYESYGNETKGSRRRVFSTPNYEETPGMDTRNITRRRDITDAYDFPTFDEIDKDKKALDNAVKRIKRDKVNMSPFRRELNARNNAISPSLKSRSLQSALVKSGENRSPTKRTKAQQDALKAAQKASARKRKKR